MPDDMLPDIEVSLTIKIRQPNNYINEEPVAERTFTSDVNTDADRFEMAARNVSGLTNAAHVWLREQELNR